MAWTEPEVVWDEKKSPPLNTEADWIKAGELVYNSSLGWGTGSLMGANPNMLVRDPAWYEYARPALTAPRPRPGQGQPPPRARSRPHRPHVPQPAPRPAPAPRPGAPARGTGGDYPAAQDRVAASARADSVPTAVARVAPPDAGGAGSHSRAV